MGNTVSINIKATTKVSDSQTVLDFVAMAVRLTELRAPIQGKMKKEERRQKFAEIRTLEDISEVRILSRELEAGRNKPLRKSTDTFIKKKSGAKLQRHREENAIKRANSQWGKFWRNAIA